MMCATAVIFTVLGEVDALARVFQNLQGPSHHACDYVVSFFGQWLSAPVQEEDPYFGWQQTGTLHA